MAENLDITVLESRAILGKSFLEVLVGKFASEAPVVIAEMVTFAGRQELELFCDQAHLLKGIAANIGASQVAELCEKLQLAPGENNLDHVEGWLEQLPHLVEEATLSLRAFVAGLPPG